MSTVSMRRTGAAAAPAAAGKASAAVTLRRLTGTLAVICGIGLMASPFALSLFDRAPAGQRIVDRFRSTMSEQGLQSLRGNFATMGAMAAQFVGQTGPGLQRALHLSGPEYEAFIAREFPRIDEGAREIPPLVAFVTPVAARLEQLHPQFAAVDSLPFLGLPLTTVPWILLAIGAGLIGLGALLLFSGLAMAPAAVALVGLLMIVLPLALSYPAKARDSKEIAAVGKLALSQQAAEGATRANRLISGVVDEATGRLIPAVADRLHLSPQALEVQLAARYPAVVRGLSAWPGIKPGAQALVARQVASVADARTLNGMGFTGLPWLMIGPGIALLAAAGLTLAAGSRQGRETQRGD